MPGAHAPDGIVGQEICQPLRACWKIKEASSSMIDETPHIPAQGKERIYSIRS